MKFLTAAWQNPTKSNKLLIWVVILVFLLVNGYLLLKGLPYLIALPFVLMAVLLAFISPDKALIALSFLAPLSIELRVFKPDLPFSFIIPTEPLLLLILIALLLQQLTKNRLPSEITTHPVSLAILAFLTWLAVATTTSEYPLVSVKYILVRAWFFGSFYFLAISLFRNRKNIERFFWAFTIGLIIVAVYAIAKQASTNLFSKHAAAISAYPFFNDHTSYAAAIAFVIPMLIGFLKLEMSQFKKVLTAGLILFFTAALILSYTRAAWLSLIFGGGVYLLIRFRIRLRTITLISLAIGAIVFSFQNQITSTLERNKAVSSHNLLEHIQSITNIHSDDSNAERINRWHSAIELFKERPIVGWGPGCYTFVYAGFQIANDRTSISTNRGDGGNARSEYLGLLSESGIPALLLYLIILGIVYYKGIRFYQQKSNDKAMRSIVMASLVAISTYVMHSTLNDFLDMDEIAAPFWAFVAVVVAAELFHTKREPTDG